MVAFASDGTPAVSSMSDWTMVAEPDYTYGAFLHMHARDVEAHGRSVIGSRVFASRDDLDGKFAAMHAGSSATPAPARPIAAVRFACGCGCSLA